MKNKFKTIIVEKRQNVTKFNKLDQIQNDVNDIKA